jgi:hypothetical protein
MADNPDTILQLLEANALTGNEILYLVTDPALTPDDRKVRLETILNYIKANGYNPTFVSAVPVPVSLGGIEAGSTFAEGTTIQEVLTRLLYPYQYPSFGSFGFTAPNPLEVGNTISAGVKNFTWSISGVASNVVPNTISIADVTAGNNILSNQPNDGSQTAAIPAVTKTAALSHVWRISAQNTKEQTFSRDFVINWRWAIWYGESTSEVLSSNQVVALRAKALATGYAGTYTMIPGGYKWFCFPSVFGTVSRFKDVATNLDVAMAPMASVLVTNSFGVSLHYNCYRTLNILGGSLQIVAS